MKVLLGVLITLILSSGVLLIAQAQHDMIAPLSVYRNGIDGYVDIYDCYPAAQADNFINVIINVDGDTAYYTCELAYDVVGIGIPLPTPTPQLKNYITVMR